MLEAAVVAGADAPPKPAPASADAEAVEAAERRAARRRQAESEAALAREEEEAEAAERRASYWAELVEEEARVLGTSPTPSKNEKARVKQPGPRLPAPLESTQPAARPERRHTPAAG